MNERIVRVDVFAYDLTYRDGMYVMSLGREIETLTSTVVRITTNTGLTGFGEVCPLGPNYLPGHSDGARSALGVIIPRLIGHDASNPAAINALMDAELRGHAYAKSAVDIACWDVFGKSTGRSVAALLGGVRTQRFPLYMAVPLGEPEQMAAYVSARRAEEIRRFQLKVGGRPDVDVARIRAVDAAAAPEDVLIVDANGGWRLHDALVVANATADLTGRILFEQPCRTLEECINFRRRSDHLVVLDEVITDLRSLLYAFSVGAMEGVNLKISKVGGLTRAKVIRDVADDLGLRLTIEDTWGGDITTAAIAHLAGSTPADTLLTVSFMNDWVNEHVAAHEPRSENGWGSTPVAAGLGVEVDVRALGAPVLTAAA